MAKISPGTGLDEKQKEKIVSMRRRWKKLHDDAKGENLKIAGRKKDGCDSVVEEAERMGIPPVAFRKKMKELDHLDKAAGVRTEIEDEIVLDAFDKMGIAIPAQTVFDFGLGEVQEAAPKKRSAKKDAEPKDDKVTSLDEHRETAAATA